MIGKRVWVGGQFHWHCAECQILCLPAPLPVFSASPKQPALSHPLLTTTPLPPLPPSCFLSSGPWHLIFGYGPQGADYGWLFACNDVITLLNLCFKLFFHQCRTGMQGSGFVILCLCHCNFAPLVSDSKPIFNTCQKKSFIWIFQLPFPFRSFGCNRLVITEKFTREWVLGFRQAIQLEG